MTNAAFCLQDVAIQGLVGPSQVLPGGQSGEQLERPRSVLPGKGLAFLCSSFLPAQGGCSESFTTGGVGGCLS